MGCSSSRLDDLPAVAHCRRRRKWIEAACTHFTTLAESHSAYMQSLSSVAETLVLTLTFFPPESSPDSGAEPKRNDERSSEPGSGHIQFTPSSDDEDNHQGAENETFSSSFYENGDREAERLGGMMLADGGGTHAPPPPPPPPPAASSLTWDLMNFFAPYDMALHYPESYNLLRERTLIDSNQPEIKEVVQVDALKSQSSDVVDREKTRTTEKVNSANDSAVKSEEKKLRDAVDVLQEIRSEFENASYSGNGVSKLLKSEADENHVFQLDSSEKANLPTILRKLSIWEQKLYAEVKAEEEMRVRHEELERKLRKQDGKGSDEGKVHATQKELTSLTPKMKIAFQVVDRISIVSSKLRDEELWPSVQDFIQELGGMWEEMLECHKRQAKAISEVAEMHRFPSDGDLTNEQVVAAMELKIKFQTWIISFCSWICAQRGFIKSLNKWLQRCLVQEPKDLSDAEESDSPVIFVTCRKWADGVKKIDGGEVIEAAQACVASVDHLLQRVSGNIQQRVIIDEDLEKKVKAMEAKEREMVKALELWKKNVAKNHATVGKNSVVLASGAWTKDYENLHPGLKGLLKSLEALAASFAQVYQDLTRN